VFEDNKPQAVATFQHVAIRGGVPQEQRAEPNTVAASKALLQNPRSRAFVVFLDTLHVDVDGSQAASGSAAGGVWAVGEFGSGDEWRQGADVDLTLTAADGRLVSTQHERVTAGARSFRSALRPGSELTPGDYTIRARLNPLGPNAEPVTEMRRVVVPASGSSGVLVSRRVPTTGNREMPAADLRFRRAEQLRADVPGPTSTTVTARLLDRMGNATAVPVAPGVRMDPDGTRWASASLALAPLAAGEYVIEISDEAGADTGKTLVAFRVVP
jgi:hypothetical protein